MEAGIGRGEGRKTVSVLKRFMLWSRLALTGTPAAGPA